MAGVIFASDAVLLTGKPVSPAPRGASSASLRSGPPIDCPAVSTNSVAEPAPIPASSPRRETVGAAGEAATRPFGSGGSGRVSARRALSGRSTPCVRQAARIVGTLTATCSASAPTKIHAP